MEDELTGNENEVRASITDARQIIFIIIRLISF